MKRLLILAAVAALLSTSAGCRFWNCLWHGKPQQQQAAVVCPSPCVSPCNPCETGATVTTVTPGPVTFQQPATP